MKRLWSIAVKDIRIMVRDRAALLVMLAMPLGLIFILGSALGNVGEGDSLDARVAIVNLDQGGLGEQFVEGLTSAEEIDAVFNVIIRNDADEVRAEVERGDLSAALIVPADLSEKVRQEEPVALEVLQDPGSEVSAGIWAGVVRAGVANASAQMIAAHTIAEAFSGGAHGAPASQPVAEGAPLAGQRMPELEFDAVTVREVEVELEKQISMISYYAAAMSGMFLLFGGMFGAFSFVRERREQTLARMMSTPASTATIVGGKALGVLLIGVLQFVVLFAGTHFLFQVDWGTNVVGTLLVGLAETVAAAGLAMSLAALGRTERAIGGIAPAFIMLFAALGGSMIPADQLPGWLLPAQVLSPVYWTVDAFLELMRGASLATVAPNIGAVLAIGLVLLGFGVWRVRYE
ncbi:MAG: ABC transporter permease [Coriobacteriia bacterium]|nr:ABC transporter permease [Coriobacteriia bacterium]MBN2839471.1 ABC transporter permease [Coriobacteriia bacterium]